MVRETEICFVRERNNLDAKFALINPSHDCLININTAFLIRQPEPHYDNSIA